MKKRKNFQNGNQPEQMNVHSASDNELINAKITEAPAKILYNLGIWTDKYRLIQKKLYGRRKGLEELAKITKVNFITMYEKNRYFKEVIDETLKKEPKINLSEFTLSTLTKKAKSTRGDKDSMSLIECIHRIHRLKTEYGRKVRLKAGSPIPDTYLVWDIPFPKLKTLLIKGTKVQDSEDDVLWDLTLNNKHAVLSNDLGYWFDEIQVYDETNSKEPTKIQKLFKE